MEALLQSLSTQVTGFLEISQHKSNGNDVTIVSRHPSFILMLASAKKGKASHAKDFVPSWGHARAHPVAQSSVLQC